MWSFYIKRFVVNAGISILSIRFDGEIQNGAMEWINRYGYISNPPHIKVKAFNTLSVFLKWKR